MWSIFLLDASIKCILDIDIKCDTVENKYKDKVDILGDIVDRLTPCGQYQIGYNFA